MKLDMKITLLASEFEAHPGQSGSLTLRKNFHERLMNFFNEHPEVHINFVYFIYNQLFTLSNRVISKLFAFPSCF